LRALRFLPQMDVEPPTWIIKVDLIIGISLNETGEKYIEMECILVPKIIPLTGLSQT
jgi:hypothetical protein